nr:MAG TPA: hypothetical protein [Caudoviricetes sp.]
MNDIFSQNTFLSSVGLTRIYTFLKIDTSVLGLIFGGNIGR